MKKKVYWISINIIVIGFGILLFGCSGMPKVTFESILPDQIPTNLEGIWIHPNPQSLNAKISIKGNSFNYQWDNGVANGRFITDGKKIQFITSDNRNWSTTYTLENNQLRLDLGKGGWHWFGAFQKIDTNQNITLDGSWRHPNPQAQEATYTFTGNQFQYNRKDGFDVSGDFGFTDNKLILTISGKIVREYICYFQNNGTVINLFSLSGDVNNYYQGKYLKN